ncbi:MAG: phosphate/phosphite/phosphonate ABC transporter substrate-binding protein [Candidatus Binatia bacterium]
MNGFPASRAATLVIAALAWALLLPVAAPGHDGFDEFDRNGETERGNPPALFRDDLTAPDTLGVGRVARDVAEHLPELQAMADHLAASLPALGFARARPVIARDNAEMIDFLRRGIVDLVSETPLSAVHFVKEGGAAILLRERRGGRASYSSVVFARADSAVRSLADLRGRRIAFEDPGSTTAFLLPLAAIRRGGGRAVPLESAAAAAPEDAAGYFFVRSEASILTAVLRRLADAGAVSDDDWRSFRSKQPGAAAELKLIHESEKVPRAFLLGGPALTAAQRESLRTILLGMQEDGPGSAVLQRYQDVDGFDALDAGLAREIQDLDPTYALLREELH